jgi:hypothetical protein
MAGNDRDKRALRRRNLALAAVIGAFVVFLFFISMVKFGG